MTETAARIRRGTESALADVAEILGYNLPGFIALAAFVAVALLLTGALR